MSGKGGVRASFRLYILCLMTLIVNENSNLSPKIEEFIGFLL